MIYEIRSKHEEPPWRKQVFKFLESDTAKGLEAVS